MSEEIVQLNFSILVPPKKWLSKFSLLFPQLQFNLMSMVPISKNQGNLLLQIKGLKLNQFWEKFTKTSEKINYNLIFQDKNSILMNILMGDPWILQTIFDAQLLLQFPFLLMNGKIFLQLVGSRKKIDELFSSNAHWKEIDISIKKIRKYCPDSLLTPRQFEILNQSLNNGFFDIPRKKSLSVLAEEIGISPSALSENIRRINKKLAEHYISCIDLPN
ncbi:helix-turn-helix domain-containing protein [Promethearchaeum syntrophicum]|uniref:Helix-turn-helix domain-containing protein n=1 Tax=Promethearchaeum syntrophicum TaxID=2594042 RepID=A0A5B9DCW4_9ARCH|nr:helix-turn-helix domain-containing protein [Candidatus Prometheoarchaeum syntrophicum]QEE17149.1 HTH DNA binding domain protein [Candidatus Prometheoarchaeum syntrophicum]